MSTIELEQQGSAPMLIAARELAALLNISTRTLWRLRSAGALPSPVQIGASVRWRVDEIKNWIAKGCPPPQARENGRQRR